MSRYRQPDAAGGTECDDYQSDLMTALQKQAENQQERRATLEEARRRWVNEDIGRLGQVEGGGHWGWGMWRYPA